MKYNWKKGLASAGAVFLGVVLAHIGQGGDVSTSWAAWKHTLGTAASATVLVEVRYIYAWLATIGSNGITTPPPTTPPVAH